MINKKWFLYITEFFSGMSVMAVELGASRLLAPYFSSSQIVWTIIIGTIMIAMALGNVIGGKIADKRKNPNHLYFLLAVAAIWIALIPFVGKFVIAGVSVLFALFITKGYLIWAAFASCFLVFVFPLLLLGMVTPTLCKYAMNNLADSGKTVGKMNALNTIGSILGTFLPTFVTIPSVGTALTFIIFALILFAIAVTYFISIMVDKHKAIKTSLIIVLLFTFMLTITGTKSNFAFWATNTVYEGESIYNYLRVTEDNYYGEDVISLSTNVIFGVQSQKPKDKEQVFIHQDVYSDTYYEYALASAKMAKLDEKEKPQVLVLGLGTGTFPSQCARLYPNAEIEGVEIDSKIVDLAREYFYLPESVKVSVNDGRAYIAATEKKYDLIMVDAYQDITIPFQMSTIEFFTIVKEHLTEDGVMIVNYCMYDESEKSINEYLTQTINKVFGFSYIYSAYNETGNHLLYTSNDVNFFEDFKTKIRDPQKITAEFNDESFQIRSRMANLFRKFVDPVTGAQRFTKAELVLTDDKAPVELLGMGALDAIIQSELEYMRDSIKGKSLKEIIEEFS